MRVFWCLLDTIREAFSFEPTQKANQDLNFLSDAVFVCHNDFSCHGRLHSPTHGTFYHLCTDWQLIWTLIKTTNANLSV